MAYVPIRILFEADASGCAVKGIGLQPLDGWDEVQPRTGREGPEEE